MVFLLVLLHGLCSTMGTSTTSTVDLAKKMKELLGDDIDQVITRIVSEKVEEHLQKFKSSIQCVCPGPRGPQGERGPPGERGLGLYPPRLVESKLDMSVVSGRNVAFSCKFFGNPLPKTYWQGGPSKTHVITNVDKEKSEIVTTMLAKNIAWSDRGNVSCYASNLFGKLNKTGSLTVLAAPIIELPKAPVVGIIGMTMDFPECKVVSVPPFNVSWERGFLSLPASRTFRQNETLRIHSIRVEDEGYYKCVASNYLGTTTAVVHLRVKPLQLSTRPKFYEYASNGSKVLACSAHGSSSQLSGEWLDVELN